jgi:hypothetical protein
VLLSHAGDGAVGVTWPRHDVDVDSCWRWRCWGDLAAALHRCRVMLAMVLSSHAGDGTTESTTRCRCRVKLATVLLSHVGNGAAEVTWP